MNATLFYLLPTEILAAIDIWVASLEHRNKFNHVISRLKYMSNPFLLPIKSEQWTLYHNFETFHWYNIVKYNWAHRGNEVRNEGYCPHYECLTNDLEYITQLTPQLLRHNELQVSLQQLSQNKNPTILYFTECIPYSNDEDCIEHAVPKFPCPRPR